MQAFWRLGVSACTSGSELCRQGREPVRASPSPLRLAVSVGLSQFPGPQLFLLGPLTLGVRKFRAFTLLPFRFRRNELHEQEPRLRSHLPGDTQRGYCL